MREESGRSLIEILGVLAIGATMLAAAYSMYKTIDNRQKRLITFETIADIAKKTKILYEYSGYTGVTVGKLITDGAIESAKLPIGTLEIDPKPYTFTIIVSGLTKDECEYFKIKKADWAAKIKPNNDDNGTCTNSTTNSFAWYVE